MSKQIVKKVKLVMECEDCCEFKPVNQILHVANMCLDCLDKLNKCFIHEVENAGIDKLSKIIGEEFKLRITNIKSSSVSLEKRKQTLYETIYKKSLEGDTISIQKKIINTYFKKVEREKPSVEWLEGLSVGEDILLYQGQCRAYVKARIIKINPSSISVKKYDYTLITDLNAVQNQTWGYNRLIWNTFVGGDTIVIKSNHFYRKGESRDDEFIEGKQSVDYGR